MKKVAIVHDYLKEFGGAEKVVETLLEIWPNADVYTTVFLPDYAGPHAVRVKKWNIKTTFLQQIPFTEKLISMYRFVAPFVFKNLDLSQYDLVLSSTAGTYTSPNMVKIGSKSKLVSYCHTPPRYLYGYPTANRWDNTYLRRFLFILGAIPMHFLRIADYWAAQKPDIIVANSEEVSKRIQKFYKRKATVVYPPIDVPKVKIVKTKKDYYLFGGRLARAKRPDLAIKAFNKMGVKLKVFGRSFGGFGEELKSIAKSNIELLGEVSNEEKFKLMSEAKAFIFPAELEDFGMVPVEAMGVGCPVIALNSGGVKESVIEGKTGTFFDYPTTKSLIEAVNRFEKMRISPKACVERARMFSKSRFIKEMKQLVQDL